MEWSYSNIFVNAGFCRLIEHGLDTSDLDCQSKVVGMEKNWSAAIWKTCLKDPYGLA